jgi:hypothetical protein
MAISLTLKFSGSGAVNLASCSNGIAFKEQEGMESTRTRKQWFNVSDSQQLGLFVGNNAYSQLGFSYGNPTRFNN